MTNRPFVQHKIWLAISTGVTTNKKSGHGPIYVSQKVITVWQWGSAHETKTKAATA